MNQCCGQLDWTGQDMTAEHHPRCVIHEQEPTGQRASPRMENHPALLRLMGTIEQLTLYSIHPEIGQTAHAPTGESYVELSLGGVIAEGNSAMSAASPEDACGYFYRFFLDYVMNCIDSLSLSVLYWREKPVILKDEIFCADPKCPVDIKRSSCPGHKRYFLWASLLISAQPVKQV